MELNALRIDETNGHRPLPAGVESEFPSPDVEETAVDESVEAGPVAEGPAVEVPPLAAVPTDDLGELPAVLESLLFAVGQPVTLARLVEALNGPGRPEVLRALEA